MWHMNDHVWYMRIVLIQIFVAIKIKYHQIPVKLPLWSSIASCMNWRVSVLPWILYEQTSHSHTKSREIRQNRSTFAVAKVHPSVCVFIAVDDQGAISNNLRTSVCQWTVVGGICQLPVHIYPLCHEQIPMTPIPPLELFTSIHYFVCKLQPHRASTDSVNIPWGGNSRINSLINV